MTTTVPGYVLYFGLFGTVLNPDLHQSEKQDLDPDPHQSEKVKVLEGYFGALEGSNLEKSEW